IQVDDRDEKVYNFSVEKEHDYYVGEDGVLVHNEGCGPMTGPTLSPQVMSALLKFLPGATEAELEATKRLIEIGNRPVDGTLEAAFDLAGYIDAACKNGCPPDIAMAPIRLGISATKVAGELIRSGRFREAIQVTAAAAKNWFKGADNATSLFKAGKTQELYNDLAKTELYATKVVERSASSVNAELNMQSYVQGYEGLNPPFKGTVKEFELSQPSYFIRLHSDSNQTGGWLMSIEDFKKANKLGELRDSLALPNKPYIASLVEVPAGTKMRMGEAAGITEWGKGGGVQFQIINGSQNKDFRDWFQKIGNINDLLK
ncbi:hypothetical protein EHQ05_07275, partial [Leptospira yasudae]